MTVSWREPGPAPGIIGTAVTTVTVWQLFVLSASIQSGTQPEAESQMPRLTVLTSETQGRSVNLPPAAQGAMTRARASRGGRAGRALLDLNSESMPARRTRAP